MLERIHKKGIELNKEELDLINSYRIREFNSDTVWGPDSLNTYRDSEIFIIKDNNIKAFGRLRPIDIYFNDQAFQIWGIGAVISIEKGRGYGRMLIEDIITFQKDNLKDAVIGFCNSDISKFYSKCGFSILNDEAKRFIYVDENDIEEKSKKEDVIYYPKDNKIIDIIKQDARSSFKHYIPKW